MVGGGCRSHQPLGRREDTDFYSEWSHCRLLSKGVTESDIRFFFFFLLKIDSRVGGRKREREGEKLHVREKHGSVASCMHPN